MRTDLLDCLRRSTLARLRPHGVIRAAILGVSHHGELPDDDLHLLVEFDSLAVPVPLSAWLRLQREIGHDCQRRVELVAVSRLEERVAAESVATLLLFDRAGSHG